MSWLVANTLVAGALALVVMLIGRWRPAPAVMHGLWLCVVLKLVTPPLFTVPIDLTPGARVADAAPAPLVLDLAAVDLRDPVVRALTEQLVAPGSAAASTALPAPAAARAPAPAPAAATAPTANGWSLEAALVLLWALGGAFVLGRFLHGALHAARRLRALGPVPPALRREVEALAHQLGVRVPALRDDPAACSPYVWAFGRTCLVLPSRTLAATSPKGRAAVLAHELAHLRRGDHWVAHAELLLTVVCWWHPLFWFARARMRLWAELACDAWAVASVPDAQIDYATVLVEAVARPGSAVPAPAVLAARPAARAAFERRLTMILNENVPCRASRAWFLPFTALALGLVTVPVAAQEPRPEPVRVEVKVNGKAVDELNAAERKALLRELLAAEEKAAQDPDGAAPVKPAKGKKAGKAKPKVAAPEAHEHGAHQHGGHGLQVEVAMPSAAELKAMMHQGLAEARAEIAADDDLRELGITDEVTRLIDDVAAGKGMGKSLDTLIKAAMKGAGKMVEKELAADEDLRAMGMTEGITRLVQGMLGDERMQEMIADFAGRQIERAMHEAKRELRQDPELRELGIHGEVEGLLDSLMSGKGSFDVQLQRIIEKAMQHGMQVEIEAGGEPVQVEIVEEPAPEAKPAPKQVKKARKASVVR